MVKYVHVCDVHDRLVRRTAWLEQYTGGRGGGWSGVVQYLLHVIRVRQSANEFGLGSVARSLSTLGGRRRWRYLQLVLCWTCIYHSSLYSYLISINATCTLLPVPTSTSTFTPVATPRHDIHPLLLLCLLQPEPVRLEQLRQLDSSLPCHLQLIPPRRQHACKSLAVPGSLGPLSTPQ